MPILGTSTESSRDTNRQWIMLRCAPDTEFDPSSSSNPLVLSFGPDVHVVLARTDLCWVHATQASVAGELLPFPTASGHSRGIAGCRLTALKCSMLGLTFEVRRIRGVRATIGLSLAEVG